MERPKQTVVQFGFQHMFEATEAVLQERAEMREE
jgi:hypothetical protein